MQLAGSQFVGTHDFAPSARSAPEVKSTVRTVYYYEVAREGDIISLRVCANGFLYNMARGHGRDGRLTRRKGSSRRNRWRKFWSAATARLRADGPARRTLHDTALV